MVPPTAFIFTSNLFLQVKSYWHLKKAWTILQSIIKQTFLFSQADQMIFSTSKTMAHIYELYVWQETVHKAIFTKGFYQ